MLGYIKALNLSGGFGFILNADDPSQEYFFHCRELTTPITIKPNLEKVRVSFDVATHGDKPGRNPRAICVQALDHSDERLRP